MRTSSGAMIDKSATMMGHVVGWIIRDLPSNLYVLVSWEGGSPTLFHKNIGGFNSKERIASANSPPLSRTVREEPHVNRPIMLFHRDVTGNSVLLTDYVNFLVATS